MMNHKPQSQIVLEEMAGTQSTLVSKTISTYQSLGVVGGLLDNLID